MAQYNYEGGLASYFILTFLSLILIPLTLSFKSSAAKKTVSCKCPECTKKDERLKKSGLSTVKLGPKLLVTVALWIVFGVVAYSAATTKSDTKIYNPFEILGIKAGTSEKDIKRHYKKLSIKFHPDKVKLIANQTMESVAEHFVELTKAYKSLTDETVRQNLEQYGHPDGKQEFSVGIAIPKWVVEGKNSMLVLAFYGAIFMGILPLVVGRWWFGSRGLTKDGVHGNTASLFFKGVTEDASIDFLVSLLSRGFSTEQKAFSRKVTHTAAVEDDLNGLETEIKVLLSSRWSTVSQTAKVPEARRALVLLYAHLLRLPVTNDVLRKEQDTLILRAPTLLTSLLTMTLSRNWAASSLQLMHLHAYLAQAILPSPLIESPSTALLQYPNVKREDTVSVHSGDVSELLSNLGDKDVASGVRAAAANSGKLDIIDAKFKVIGERIVTPNAIVNLLFRAQVVPRVKSEDKGKETELSVDEAKAAAKALDERENTFLGTRHESEVFEEEATELTKFAHAPHWPENRKPSWWVMICNQPGDKVIFGPQKFTDVPEASGVASGVGAKGRLYKLQFQSPPQVGTYAFRAVFVSDTFVGDDLAMDLSLTVEDVSALTTEEAGAEDEISDPDEDTLAGQMAAMRGGAVKRRADDEESDESDTDGDDSDSSSDSSDDD
ncbi:Translocation protein SEC63 homolog [Mus musculus] [Rhizoctonia solani]|uniref:Translocation protein SEC63 homolog [Mus musculus] n=1 Tax=Rhizoctonia solani TaxID=456999 RepID=A0A0K6GEZ2_9AGAM|nr:Translocation protein SEC63 homolog [Mus musculus] [Rhizoctonia solani]